MPWVGTSSAGQFACAMSSQRTLKDLRIIEQKNGRWSLTKDAVAVAIPSTIQDVIMARVDSLPEATKGLLQTGSVAGRAARAALPHAGS